MVSVVGYINIARENNLINKLSNLFCLRIKVEKYDDRRYFIYIGKNKVNEKNIKKIKLTLLKNGINTIVFSNELCEIRKLFSGDNRFKIIDGKLVMMYLLPEIFQYIYSYRKDKQSQDELYIMMNSDRYYNLVVDIAKYFKSINIITINLKKLRRLDKRLENIENIVYSISCNKMKGLKRAKIILNFDFDSKMLRQYKTRNDVIIVNCSSNRLDTEKSFHGIIVDNVVIDIEKKDFLYNAIESKIEIETNLLYESLILDYSYSESRNKIVIESCKTRNLVGENGNILFNELKENIY